MANWRYKIRLNEAVRANNEEFDLTRFEEPIPEAAKERLAAEIEKAPPLAVFALRLREATTIAEVNRILSRVYDAADDSLVWCGWI